MEGLGILIFLAALLLFGRWSDVVGRRPVLLAGIAMAAARMERDEVAHPLD
mgnify:CR=1 FL=1